MSDYVSAADHVLVLGASSQVGRFLVPRLLASGCQVDALTRVGRPDGFPELDRLAWIRANVARTRLADYSVLVSAGPLPLAMDYANAMPALRMVSATSSSSVLTKAESTDASERDMIVRLREAEEGLRNLSRPRRLPLLILRPTLIYGCGLDRNLTRIAGVVKRLGFMPLSTRSGGLRQPLHAEDLAIALLAGLEPRERRELVSPLCGGETLDYRSMVRRVFTALEKTPRIVALPPEMLVGLMKFARGIGALDGVGPEMVFRQGRNLVFDDQEARETLGLRPRRFHPGADAFVPPDPAYLRRLSEG